MKLHLPSSLRVALMALYAVGSSAVAGTSTGGYSLSSNTTYRTLVGHTTQGECSWRDYSVWDDPGSSRIEDSEGEVHFIDNYYRFSYQLIFTIHSHHSCYKNAEGDRVSDGSNYSFTFTGVEDGQGNDITWNCSTESTPGVWILADSEITSPETPIVFRNYGNMVVDGCDHRYVYGRATSINADGIVSYTETLKHFNSELYKNPGITSMPSVGFDMLVKDTKSFTFRNGYTEANGVLASNADLIRFQNVDKIVFENNTMKNDGNGIVYNVNFEIDGAQNVIFSKQTSDATLIAYCHYDEAFKVSNVSDTLKISENSGVNLFYCPSTIEFKNIEHVLISDNNARFARGYNDHVSFVLENCGDFVFAGNTAEDGLFIKDNDGSSVTFRNSDSVTFSGNTYTSRLFDCRNAITFENVKNISFASNTATAGLLIGSSGISGGNGWSASGIEGTFDISSNNVTYTSSSDGAITAGFSLGPISISGVGVGDQRADLFTIGNNKI